MLKFVDIGRKGYLVIAEISPDDKLCRSIGFLDLTSPIRPMATVAADYVMDTVNLLNERIARLPPFIQQAIVPIVRPITDPQFVQEWHYIETSEPLSLLN